MVDTVRPFANCSIDELELYVRAGWNDGERLSALSSELCRRSTKRATALFGQVHRRINELREGPGGEQSERHRIQQLERDLAIAKMRIVALEADLALDKDKTASASQPGSIGDVLARVHLTATAPKWLIAEVRRAFRRKFHPDNPEHATAERKKLAEDVFKEADNLFDSVERMKG